MTEQVNIVMLETYSQTITDTKCFQVEWNTRDGATSNRGVLLQEITETSR